MQRCPRPGTRLERGLTLVELVIVVVIIGVIAGVAVPNVVAARIENNETSAIKTLRTLLASQTQFQEGVRADVDRDGVGEYGMLRELSGTAPVRTTVTGGSTGTPLSPALLASTFGKMNADGEVVRAGYHFKVFLPGENGRAMAERSLTQLESSGPASIDSDLCETNWCAYAWPATADESGEHTYFVNQQSGLTKTIGPDQRQGPNGIVVADAGIALVAGAERASVLGSAAVKTTGRDGRLWLPVR